MRASLQKSRNATSAWRNQAAGAWALCSWIGLIALGHDCRAEGEWIDHFQTTTVTQTHPAFHSPYASDLSLKPGFEIPTSFTATLYVGHRLWRGAALFGNAEETAGSGLSATHGVAAFPNGEVYRVDDASPRADLARLFVRQDIALGGEAVPEESGPNRFGEAFAADRLSLIAGKFSLNDYLDDNTYSHDPRSQFLNWALMDTGAWDYAADTRGYTWGILADLRVAQWSARFALVQVPAVANGLDMDGDLGRARAENLELEYRYRLGGHPGKARWLGFLNHARMGNYRQAIDSANAPGARPDVTATRAYRTKGGAGLGIEQELTADLGVFARLGWNDGNEETWAFTEIDRSFSVGASWHGSAWRRPDDVVGVALLIDALSADHAEYLAAGGAGFIVGDGGLSYATEQIAELYYAYRVSPPVSLSLDIQYVNHPGYNADRGPVPVYGLRVHCEI